MNKGTVEVEMKTKGFEDAAEDIEMIADAMDAFPSTIKIKARDCRISIHNTNYIDQKQPAQKYAKGGLTADKGPEVVLLNLTGRATCQHSPTRSEKRLQRISATCATAQSVTSAFLATRKNSAIS